MASQRKVTEMPDPRTRGRFRRTLLTWYERHARAFPWRLNNNPFAILLSEVLLQRTQAQQVAANFDRILRAFPRPVALARASDAKISAALKPLGLAKRATTLKQMGLALMERSDGETPTEFDDLITLPGVGRYIASATACFAGGHRLAVVDANVIRMLERFFGAVSDRARPREDRAMWDLAAALLPRTRVADYNRALIDFASLVCRPRAPRCAECPLRQRFPAASGFLGTAA
jgi:A/G-specific adenine glycosylase